MAARYTSQKMALMISDASLTKVRHKINHFLSPTEFTNCRSDVVKVAGLKKKQIDIIRPQWILDCIESHYLLSLEAG